MEKENDSPNQFLRKRIPGGRIQMEQDIPCSLSVLWVGHWQSLASTLFLVEVDENNILACRQAAIGKPMVLLPSHKSHVDYLMMSYICFAYNLPMPIICAGENLNIPGVGRILRYAGCFFMKRSFRSKTMDKYRKACSKYVNGVLRLYESGTAGMPRLLRTAQFWNF